MQILCIKSLLWVHGNAMFFWQVHLPHPGLWSVPACDAGKGRQGHSGHHLTSIWRCKAFRNPVNEFHPLFSWLHVTALWYALTYRLIKSTSASLCIKHPKQPIVLLWQDVTLWWEDAKIPTQGELLASGSAVKGETAPRNKMCTSPGWLWSSGCGSVRGVQESICWGTQSCSFLAAGAGMWPVFVTWFIVRCCRNEWGSTVAAQHPQAGSKREGDDLWCSGSAWNHPDGNLE